MNHAYTELVSSPSALFIIAVTLSTVSPTQQIVVSSAYMYVDAALITFRRSLV